MCVCECDQLPRDNNAYLRRLTFNVGDNNNIFVSVSYPLTSPSAPLQFMELVRLNNTFAVIVYRNPNLNYQLFTGLIDVSSAVTVALLPATSLSPGTAKSFGLLPSVAVVTSDRLVYLYTDASGQAYVMDAGVFGPTIVAGR
jgi:hypothetical protein